MEKYTLLNSSLDSTQPLVDRAQAADYEDDEEQDLPSQSWRRNTRMRNVAIHTTLLALNLFICMGFVLSARSSDSITSIRTAQSRSSRVLSTNVIHKASSQASVEYKDQPFDLSSIYRPDGSVNLDRPQFGGPPRKELLDSWSNLTQYMNIRLSPDELGQFAEDDQVVRLTDGSGAFGTLAVYHGIHCISRLHRYLYQEYYYPDLTEPEQILLLKHHTEHCIDWIRQYIQCNADLTVIPMYWGTQQARPMSTDSGNHRCVNWDSLQSWAEERTFDAYEPGLLVHPKFGDPYADNKSNKIGLVAGESLLKDHGSHADHRL